MIKTERGFITQAKQLTNLGLDPEMLSARANA